MSSLVDRDRRAIGAAAGSDVALLIGRLLMAYIFVRGGWGHITNLGGFGTYLAGKGAAAGMSYPLAVVAACVEFFGAICIVLGLATRYVALLMAVFTLIAAFLGHPYWSVPAAEVVPQQINFNKNLAILGGFLVLYAAGPGRWSIDRRGS